MKQKTWNIVWKDGGWVDRNTRSQETTGLAVRCMCCGFANLDVLHILINRGDF